MEPLGQVWNNIGKNRKETCHQTYQKLLAGVSLLSIHFPMNGWRGFNLRSERDHSYLRAMDTGEHPRLREHQGTNVNEKSLKIIVEKIALARMRFPDRIMQKDYIPHDNEF
jgi:hypothetical protein